MLEIDTRCVEENGERFIDSGNAMDSIGDKSAWAARRRIERLRELRRLRDLLDDPEFNDLD